MYSILRTFVLASLYIHTKATSAARPALATRVMGASVACRGACRYVQGNSLSGTLPSQFGLLTGLTYLYAPVTPLEPDSPCTVYHAPCTCYRVYLYVVRPLADRLARAARPGPLGHALRPNVTGAPLVYSIPRPLYLLLCTSIPRPPLQHARHSAHV